MPAAGPARPEVRPVRKHDPHGEIVLADEITHLAGSVPVRAELEMPVDFYGKKPRVSLMILMYLSIALVLSHGLDFVEGYGKGFFVGLTSSPQSTPSSPRMGREGAPGNCLITPSPAGDATEPGLPECFTIRKSVYRDNARRELERAAPPALRRPARPGRPPGGPPAATSGWASAASLPGTSTP